jgi:Ca2+-binding EF-hand superfamily protein
MQVCRKRIAATVAALTIIASITIAAVQAGAEPNVARTPLLFRSFLTVGPTLNRYLEQLRPVFARLDADGDGLITERDVDFHDNMQRVRMRAASLQEVMMCDLDGDGFVTEGEARSAMKYLLRDSREPERQRMKVDQYVDHIMTLDANKDGKVSLVEARNLDTLQIALTAGLAGEAARALKILQLDSTSTAELTLQQYEDAAEAFFRAVDTDNDGIISRQERDAVPLH